IVSCVFRHFSQYKYNTVIPKQPAHFLPKSGHDSATYFFLSISSLILCNCFAQISGFWQLLTPPVFSLMTYPYLVLCVTDPFAKSLDIIDFISLSLLSYTVRNL
ncbi:hypothetical protein P4281_28575, partial [Bacillus thuringiensis]|nr:hypothetical protein [Bacillus thuringiensis]